MTRVAVGGQPAGRMGVRMRVNRAVMTQGTPGSPRLAGVTLQAVILTPARIVGLGAGFLMAGRAKILLVADQAL